MTGLHEPEVAEPSKPDVELSSESAGNEDLGAPAAPYTAEGQEEEEGELPAEFEKLWKLTSENPLNFNTWTDLLQYCEQEVTIGNVIPCIDLIELFISFHYFVQGHLRASCQAFNAFLARYPLCYGYWKKFADIERRAGHYIKAEEVRVMSSTNRDEYIVWKRNKRMNFHLL